jgi:hypothetical protein
MTPGHPITVEILSFWQEEFYCCMMLGDVGLKQSGGDLGEVAWLGVLPCWISFSWD